MSPDPFILARHTALGGMLAALCNAVVWALCRSFDISLDAAQGDPALHAIGLVQVMVASMVPAVVAAAVVWGLMLVTERPRLWFQVMSGLGFVLSLVGPLTTPTNGVVTRAVLAAMHAVAAAAICTRLLAMLPPDPTART